MTLRNDTEDALIADSLLQGSGNAPPLTLAAFDCTMPSIALKLGIRKIPKTRTFTSPPLMRWKEQLRFCDRPEEIIGLLRLFSLTKLADRISYLKRLSAEMDEDEAPMIFESLKRFALLAMEQRRLGDPAVGLSPDGCIQAEWHFGGGKHLAMKFLTDGRVRFAAIRSGAARSRLRKSVNGTLPPSEMMEVLSAIGIKNWPQR